MLVFFSIQKKTRIYELNQINLARFIWSLEKKTGKKPEKGMPRCFHVDTSLTCGCFINLTSNINRLKSACDLYYV